jgi:hypothetical protein
MIHTLELRDMSTIRISLDILDFTQVKHTKVAQSIGKLTSRMMDRIIVINLNGTQRENGTKSILAIWSNGK